MIPAPKIKHLLFALRSRPLGMPLGNGWRVDKASFAALRMGRASYTNYRTLLTYPEIAASPCDVTDLLRMLNFLSLSIHLLFRSRILLESIQIHLERIGINWCRRLGEACDNVVHKREELPATL